MDKEKKIDYIKFTNGDNIPKIFDFGKLITTLKKKPIYLGKLKISSSKIGVGEILFNKLPCTKGYYDIYLYFNSLIAILSSKNLNNQIFTLTKYEALCDIGMFGFNDFKRIYEPIKKLNNNFMLPEFDGGLLLPEKGNKLRIKKHDAYYLYNHIFSDDSNYSDEDNEPIGLFAGNNFGDGNFRIYSCKFGYLIMSYDLENEINKLLDN
jgi:hypothetical protein